MGKIKVAITTFLEIDEDSISSDPDQKLEDIQEQKKWAIQRVQQGYDERVPWSIDYYLNDMMPIWIKELMDDKHGVPMFVFTDEEIESMSHANISDEEDNSIMSAGRERWDAELRKIILGFEAAKKIEEGWIKRTDDSPEWKAFNEGFESLKEHWFGLWS